MKFHSRNKSTQKLGYRTPDHKKGQVFRGVKATPQPKFNPIHFKVQHKG